MKQFHIDIGDKKVTLTCNDFTPQADGSVLAQCGQTIVLATAVQEKTTKPEADFFPLIVNYDERFYAGGRILGSRFVRREGKPSDEAVLTSRMIDRALRPLFNKHERRDTQVIITVLSFDRENDPDVLALLAASAALAISDIPFNGPLGVVRFGKVGGKLVLNPTYKEREESELDMVFAGKRNLITMIEAQAKEISEEETQKLFKKALEEFDTLIAFQESIAEELGKGKREVEIKEPDSTIQRAVKTFCQDNVEKALSCSSDRETKEALHNVRNALREYITEELGPEALGQAFALFDEELQHAMQEKILENNERSDGRKADELRELGAEVGLFSRMHGSALFKRGLTHGLSIVTLGAPGDERWVEGMEVEEKQRFMHHYNFPPFSVGEVSPLRAPSRRELGHGYLAQKAVEPMLPDEEEFPYTIRAVTEILSSNGSTSMAATCATTLALMDAGVPIKKPVAGIAMGLVYDSEKRFAVLTDIQGPEDHDGHMDCKVAGTKDGITAIQLDTKLEGVPLAVLEQTLKQAKDARAKILKVMEKAIEKPREELSKFAPRLYAIKVEQAKIRFIIGPGGETINGIIDKTGAKIDIEDDGTVFITADDEASALAAKEMVEAITRDIKPGDVLKAKISGIVDFGAFAQLAPGKEGLIHISELADGYVKSVGDVVKLGQEVEVKVLDVDNQGKIRLTLKKDTHGTRHREKSFQRNKK